MPMWKNSFESKRKINMRQEFRSKKIKDYINIFYPELKKDLKECIVLELGCGKGRFSFDIAPFVKKIKSIDCVYDNIKGANENKRKLDIENIEFEVNRIENYKDNNRYDIVILSDVLEHVENPYNILATALCFLKEDGIMYVNVPNRYWFIESHTHIPLFGYLPNKFATWISTKFDNIHRKFSNTNLIGFKEFKKLMMDFPINYNLKTIETKIIYRIGKKFVDVSTFFWNFAPAFQVIITWK